jgi:AcrR family transcriptional regulator
LKEATMARPKSDIDLRIVRAARERFLHDGVDGASLRSIADEAGTSVGMVYYYFPTKDDLFLAVVEETYAKLLARLEERTRREPGVEARVRVLFRALAEIDDEELTVVRLVLREALVSSTRRTHIVARFLKGHVPLVAGALLEGVTEGEVRDDLPIAAMMLATGLLGVMPQVAARLAKGALPAGLSLPASEALASATAEILLHGIARRRGGSTPRG